MLLRALIAAVLTIALSATAVASTVLLEIDDVVSSSRASRRGGSAINIPEVTEADAGDPRTFLLLGSDARYGDRR